LAAVDDGSEVNVTGLAGQRVLVRVEPAWGQAAERLGGSGFVPAGLRSGEFPDASWKAVTGR
jgi:hypothetical protein